MGKERREAEEGERGREARDSNNPPPPLVHTFLPEVQKTSQPNGNWILLTQKMFASVLSMPSCMKKDFYFFYFFLFVRLDRCDMVINTIMIT